MLLPLIYNAKLASAHIFRSYYKITCIRVARNKRDKSRRMTKHREVYNPGSFLTSPLSPLFRRPPSRSPAFASSLALGSDSRSRVLSRLWLLLAAVRSLLLLVSLVSLARLSLTGLVSLSLPVWSLLLSLGLCSIEIVSHALVCTVHSAPFATPTIR
jgi:hypothetical protein